MLVTGMVLLFTGRYPSGLFDLIVRRPDSRARTNTPNGGTDSEQKVPPRVDFRPRCSTVQRPTFKV